MSDSGPYPGCFRREIPCLPRHSQCPKRHLAPGLWADYARWFPPGRLFGRGGPQTAEQACRDDQFNQSRLSKGDGLVPAIAQDAATGEVLMLAYMNPESYAETLATGRAVYSAAAAKSCGAKARKAATCRKSKASISTAIPTRSCSKSTRSAVPPATRATVASSARSRPRGSKWSAAACSIPNGLQEITEATTIDGQFFEFGNSRRQFAGGYRRVVSPAGYKITFNCAQLFPVDRR